MNALLEEAGLQVTRVPHGPEPEKTQTEAEPMKGFISIPAKNVFERFVMKTADKLSLGQLAALLKMAMKDLRVALCLHRVGTPPASTLDPSMKQLYIEAEA